MKSSSLLLIFFLLFLNCNFSPDLSNFKEIPKNDFLKTQLQFPRVRKAFEKKEIVLKKLLLEHEIYSFEIDLFLRAFKKEKKLEVWAKPKNEVQYRIIKTYNFCNTSGTLGPKRKEGDYQIPEGFYHISYFNPKSNFLLSLKINYPNASDKILSDPTNPGSEIYIHGGCQTVGCIPITNNKIQELYILSVLAKNGTHAIPVHIFPFQMTYENLRQNLLIYPQHETFWNNLQKEFIYFEKEKSISIQS
jgi:murein L,D-transpeptidase YafK